MNDVMMQCGHAANATDGNGNPCCVICVGFHPGAEVAVDGPLDLDGRAAQCIYCRRVAESKPSLAFFEHKPDALLDGYYCGCRGWD